LFDFAKVCEGVLQRILQPPNDGALKRTLLALRNEFTA
jgi:hypothetical protein